MATVEARIAPDRLLTRAAQKAVSEPRASASRLARLVAFLLCSTLHAADNIAVLPLFNQSKIPNLDWIGESIAETVRESLAAQGLLAVSREDRMEVFRRMSIRPNALLTRASVIKIGESLDASQIVFGQFEVTPDPANPNSRGTIRLNTRTIDLKHTKSGPEFEAAGQVDDLSMLQTHIAWQFLKYLDPKSAPSEDDFRRLRPPVRVDAVEHYIRGLLASNPEQKQKLFLDAARLDERFSEPCFQLGRMFLEKKDYRSAAQWLVKVDRGDSHYMESEFLLGLARYYQNDFDGAATQFQQVAAAVPLNEVFNNLGAAQSRRNLPAALDNFRKALAGDEADPDYWFNTGYALWKAEKFEEAAQDFRAVLDRTPNDGEAIAMLGRCLKRDGPRPLGTRSDGKERVKRNFEMTAFRQLQAELKK